MQMVGSAGDVAQRSGLIARLFEESEGPAGVVDGDSLIVYANRAWEAFFGERRSLPECVVSVDGHDPEGLRAAARTSGFSVGSCVTGPRPGQAFEIVCVADFVAGLDLVLIAPLATALRHLSTSGADAERTARGGASGEPAYPTTRRLLTAREVEIVNLLAKGLSGARVASHLDIAESTVQAHVRNAMKKTGAANRTALVAFAMAEGLVRA